MAQKYALIIGCSEFSDSGLAQLLTPAADTQELARVLRDPQIGAFDQVDALVNQPAALAQRSIARFFRNRQRDDLLLLYFSGHGVLDFSGRLYLAFKDTERELLSGTAIPAEFITKEMDGTDSRRVVLILDCCHSGAFARGTKGVVGASVGTASAFEGSGHGHVVLTASDATQYAWEGEQVTGQPQFSLFTRHLIEGLRTGVADADADGWITVDELFDYAHRQVVNQTPNQRPYRWNYKQQGEIVLARNPHPPQPQVAVRALPPELLEMVIDPRPLVRKSAVAELAVMLRRQPPEYEAAALTALRQLADPASEDSNQTLSAARQALAAWDAEQLAARQAALDKLLAQADAECQAGHRAAAIALYEQAARQSEGEAALATVATRAQAGIAQCRADEAAHEQKQVEEHARARAEVERERGRSSPAPKPLSSPLRRIVWKAVRLAQVCAGLLVFFYVLQALGVGRSSTTDVPAAGATSAATPALSGATANPRAATVAAPVGLASPLPTTNAVSPAKRVLLLAVGVASPPGRKLTDLSGFVADALYDTLIANPAPGGKARALASGVSISADGRTLTYKLRPGVTWHDGKPFTADDVAATINYWNDQYHKGNENFFSHCSVLACGWPVIAGVSVVDNLTLVVTLSYAGDGFALEALYVLPASFWRNRNPDSVQLYDVVGTGPLVLVDWTSDGSTFFANQKYFNGAPAIQQWRVVYVSDDNAVRAAFLSGQVDVGLALNGTVFATIVQGIQPPKLIGDRWDVTQWRYK